MEVLVLQRAARLLRDLPSHLPATHDWVLPELWLACYLLLIPVFASVTFAPPTSVFLTSQIIAISVLSVEKGEMPSSSQGSSWLDWKEMGFPQALLLFTLGVSVTGHAS